MELYFKIHLQHAWIRRVTLLRLEAIMCFNGSNYKKSIDEVGTFCTKGMTLTGLKIQKSKLIIMTTPL